MRRKSFDALPLMSFIAGMLAVFIFRRNLAAEASLMDYFGYLPAGFSDAGISAETVQALFKAPLIGLLYFNFFDIINVGLVAVLFIPVFRAFLGRSKAAAVIGIGAMACCLGLYMASNNTLFFFCNSRNPAGITAVLADRSLHQTLAGAALLLLYSFGLYMTIMMRRLGIFSKYTFVLGLLANLIGLTYFPLNVLTQEFGYLAIVLAAPFTIIWHANIAFNVLKERGKGSRRNGLDTAPAA